MCANRLLIAPLLPVLLLTGCQFQQYREKPLAPSSYLGSYEQRNLSAAGLREFFPECGLPKTPWPPPRWNIEALECAAMYFHPDLARARASIDVSRAQEISAGQRPNPSVNVNLEHHSGKPAAGSPWGIGPTLDIPIEYSGRRVARIERALAQSSVAEAELDGRIWAVRRNVRDRVMDYADALRRVEQIRQHAIQLQSGVAVLQRREEMGLASSFEVSSMRIESQRIRVARSSAAASFKTAEAELAAGVSVPVTTLQAVAIDPDPLNRNDMSIEISDPATLQRCALTGRTDIRRALQEYIVTEKALKEEIAKQYPDFTLSPGYFFDPTDNINIWTFAASMVLPLINRNEGPIAEAEARRELAARAMETVQATAIGEVQTAYAGYQELRKAIDEAKTMTAEVAEQERRVQRQFDLGEADKLAVVRAGMETLNARMLQADLATEAWRALFRLEDAVQSSLRSSGARP